MKRLRNLIIFSIIICLSIGSFYLYSAVHASGLPQFYLKKENGNKKEIQSLFLSANLGVGEASEGLTISSTGSKYDSERSFLERFSTQFENPYDGLASYRLKYRNFMRGKQNLSSFYEDASSVAYAGMAYKVTNQGLENFTFQISVLNKANKKATNFKAEVPNVIGTSQVDVQDVQKRGQQLDVITSNNMIGTSSDNGKTELHDYQFNLTDKKLVNDRTIMSVPAIEKNNYIYLNCLTKTDEASPNSYLVFSKVTQPVNGGTGTQNSENYVYDLHSKILKRIPLSQEIASNNVLANVSNCYNGANIFFTNTSDKSLEFITFNLKKNSVVSRWTLSLSSLAPQSQMYLFIKANRVYIAVINNSYEKNENQLSTNVWVTNLNGKVLYKGVLAKQGNNQSEEGSLQINSVFLK